MIQITDHQIHFTGKSYSYIMMIDGNGRLFHKYFGKKLKKGNLHLQPPGWHCWDVMETMLPSPDNSQPSEKTPEGFVQEIPGLDTQQMEYPGFGYLDLRTPAISVRTTDNPLVLDFHVADVHIEENVKSPMGLPGLRNTSKEAEQLVISMKDDELDLELDLIYTVFPEEDVFARRACLKNSADQQYLIEKMMSFSMDFPTGEDYEVLSFPGKWGNERRLQRLKLTQGTMILDSNRGGSSHCMNPFAVLCSKDTSEKTGEAFAAALEYSGNHQTVFEKDQYGIVRMQQGISEKGLFYPLQKGETLEVPESVIIYSDEGFGKMSRSCHDFIRRHILREDWAWKERPVLINNPGGDLF